jgi:hypothetical protein
LRVGGLAYAWNDTLLEAAITVIMVRGYRLPLRFGRNISIVRATSS